MKVRECWGVLAEQAEKALEEAQQKKQMMQQSLDKLESSKERLKNMISEYSLKAKEKEQELHSVSESHNARQFILQLLQLIERVNADIGQAKANLALADKAVQQAQQEKLKMRTLEEQEVQAVKTYQRKQEQKQMDALGLTLFNTKAMAQSAMGA